MQPDQSLGLLSALVESFSNLINIAVYGLMVAAIVRGVFRRDGVGLTASALTTLGIFGTFLGITVGLYALGAKGGDLAANVPTLLTGMKVAFVTSVVGIFLSLVVRYLPFVSTFFEPNETVSAKGKTVDDLWGELHNAANSQKQQTALDPIWWTPDELARSSCRA